MMNHQGAHGDGHEQLHDLFHGFNLGQDPSQHGKHGTGGQRMIHTGLVGYPAHQNSAFQGPNIGLNTSKHPTGPAAPLGAPLGPIMDLADGGLLTQSMPQMNGLGYGSNIYGGPAATFPHLNMVHPSAISDVGYHSQHQVEFQTNNPVHGIPQALIGYDGLAPQSNMGWGGQAIEDTQNSGYKAMWFGKGQPQGRGANGAYNNGYANGRRGKYRGKTGGGNGRNGSRGMTSRSRSVASDFNGSEDSSTEVSIDSLINQISHVPQTEPISQSIYSLLPALDSRAMASLLKELSRIGLSSRAIELFDGVRLRDAQDPLAQALLDVFSYTAAISLCITTHDVERALKLASEMKSKNIPCNVHTYTALMNVCIKCSRYGTALETYEAMQKDGCVPNVVTFNTLVDVYGKTGAWEQAIGVLDIMRRQGVDPVLRTYNTLLIACNMCNQPREAINAYKRMLEEGFNPNSTTYNALISAYGKSGQLEKVMEIFQEMTCRGCERNVITYSSLISACEKAGQWELALELFQEMARERCNPNTVTFNSLITALGQGGQWEKAQKIFDQMGSRNCKPDVVTYTALISAMEKGGQWRLALKAYEQMRKQGCKADAIVYNAVVNALWETGIVWAQRVSFRVFKTALSEGHFPQQSLIPGLVRAEVNLHATTSGVAMLSLFEWLMNLRRFVEKHGVETVPSKVTIVTDRGRGSREQGNLVVKEAVVAMMGKWRSPFCMSTQKTYANNPAMEADGVELAQWVISSAFESNVFAFFPCSEILPRRDDDNRTLDELTAEAVTMLDDPGHHKETAVEDRCTAAFAAVKHFEKTHGLIVQNMGYPYLQKRAHLIKSCLAINSKLGAPEESGHDAVLLMDRVMSTTLNLAPEVFDLMAAACVLISYDLLENAPSVTSSDQIEKAAGLPAWAIQQTEWSIRQALEQDTAAISTIRCVKLLLERLGAENMSAVASQAISGDALALCTDCISDTAFLNCRPSIVAAAVVYADRRSRGVIPFWPSALAKLTGYVDVSALELSVAIKTAQRICGARVQLAGLQTIGGNNTMHREPSVESNAAISMTREFSLPVADISASTQAMLQSFQESAAALNVPKTPDDTDDNGRDPSSGNQSAFAPSVNNENSVSGPSSEDDALLQVSQSIDKDESLW